MAKRVSVESARDQKIAERLSNLRAAAPEMLYLLKLIKRHIEAGTLSEAALLGAILPLIERAESGEIQ